MYLLRKTVYCSAQKIDKNTLDLKQKRSDDHGKDKAANTGRIREYKAAAPQRRSPLHGGIRRAAGAE
jgi:hypothetical protein